MFTNYGATSNHSGKCVVHQSGVSIERELPAWARTRVRTIPAGAVLATVVRAGMARVGDTTPMGIILVSVILGSPTRRSARSRWCRLCHRVRMGYHPTPIGHARDFGVRSTPKERQ